MPDPTDLDWPDELEVRAEHLEFIRSLEVFWLPVESGAPALNFGPPASPEETVLAKLRDLCGTPEASRDAMVTFYREGMFAAEAFLSNAALAPGRYRYQDPLGAGVLAGQPFVAERLCAVDSDTVTVEVRPEHLALLARANVRVFDDDGVAMGVAIDPKRPYGDLSFYVIDMAAILGLAPEGLPYRDDPSRRELSEPQMRRLDHLHQEMQPVLQALLREGKLTQTRFRRVPPRRGPWRPY